jgi:hypothetical protein
MKARGYMPAASHRMHRNNDGAINRSCRVSWKNSDMRFAIRGNDARFFLKTNAVQ